MKQSINRRRFLGMLGGAAAASILAACAPAAPPAPTSAPLPATPLPPTAAPPPTAVPTVQPTAVPVATEAVVTAEKTITNNGVKIHYVVEGKGTPLMMVMGIVEWRLETWRKKGYAAPLSQDYQLVLVDMRGQGDSSAPSGPDFFRPEAIASDMLAVMDDLGIKKAHYMGHVLAGLAGWHLATTAPERLHSLIVSGWSPFGVRTEAQKKDFGEHPVPPVDFNWPGIADKLSSIKMPVLLVDGDADTFYPDMKEAATQLPNATLVSTPNSGSFTTLDDSKIVLPPLQKFLASIKV